MIKLIGIIKELQGELIYNGIKGFIKRFKLSKKNALTGSIVNVEEEKVEKIFKSEDEENKLESDRINNEWQRSYEASAKYAKDILNRKTNDWFISKINQEFNNTDPIYFDYEPSSDEYQRRLELHNFKFSRRINLCISGSIPVLLIRLQVC